MPRKSSPRTNQYPIHVVARSNNREFFPIPADECWEIFKYELARVRKDFGFETHSFVMMGNHYHWLLTTPEVNLGDGMCRFQTNVSCAISRKATRINHIFGGRYNPTVITNPVYYANVYRYVVQNPMRAGICDRFEDYPYTSLTDKSIKIFSANRFECEIPNDRPLREWLNELPLSKVDGQIRLGLRKKVFKFPQDKTIKTLITGREYL